jgi:hypothetical protein
VHNLVDRDFYNNNFLKECLLSKFESDIIKVNNQSILLNNIPRIESAKEGLLMKIIGTFLKEPPESMYRFWLSSCMEAYIRGSTGMEQLLVSHCGVLSHIINVIVDFEPYKYPSSNLQTVFDLLGEICKSNITVIELIQAMLLKNNKIERFFNVIINNLVESNVFIRSLYLTIENKCEMMHSNKCDISQVCY